MQTFIIERGTEQTVLGINNRYWVCVEVIKIVPQKKNQTQCQHLPVPIKKRKKKEKKCGRTYIEYTGVVSVSSTQSVYGSATFLHGWCPEQPSDADRMISNVGAS